MRKKLISIHVFHSTSKSKDNGTMKFDQLIEYNAKNILFNTHAENEAWKLVPDLFLFSKKALYKVRVNGQRHNFNKFW